jgi:hypothetical protein
MRVPLLPGMDRSACGVMPLVSETVGDAKEAIADGSRAGVVSL